MAGPLNPKDWPDILTSPFGVIPKSTPGKWRLITTLYFCTSYSVNDGIRRVLAFFLMLYYYILHVHGIHTLHVHAIHTYWLDDN